jgi:hypothetical protein
VHYYNAALVARRAGDCLWFNRYREEVNQRYLALHDDARISAEGRNDLSDQFFGPNIRLTDLDCPPGMRATTRTEPRTQAGRSTDVAPATPAPSDRWTDRRTLVLIDGQSIVPNQTSIELGVALGGTFVSGNGTATGIDSFGGILRVDRRPLNFDASSFTIGGLVTFYTPLIGTMPFGMFVRGGVLVSTNSETTTSFVGLNMVPRSSGTATLKRDWAGILTMGANFPLSDRASFQVGAGATITSNELNVVITDVGAGVFAQIYGGTQNFLTFDPTVTTGVHLLIAPNWTVGADVNVSFTQAKTVTFRSPVFASQEVAIRVGDAVNVAALASINYRLGPGLRSR